MTNNLEIYGTANTSQNSFQGANNLATMISGAEHCGLTGLLVFHGHLAPDPWVLAGAIIQQSRALVPIVALQPNSLPPHTAAKMVSSLIQIYGRRIDLNLITGAAGHELSQLRDTLDHEQRYARLTSYTSILMKLLTSNDALTENGPFYAFSNLKIGAAIPESLHPRLYVAGSSQESRNLASELGCIRITHPEPVDSFAQEHGPADARVSPVGIRLGIIARETAESAWATAMSNYHVSRAEEMRLALKRNSESDWIRRLATLATDAKVHDEVYWTGMFERGRGGAPFIVGSYQQVASYIDRYVALGVSKLILAQMDDMQEYQHAANALSRLAQSS
jgi:alkanesulfonate monooxygenase